MLFVVATPLGNLGDLTPRAVEVLGTADLIAAEDTRRCRQLLSHLGLSRPVVAYHDHNEQQRESGLLRELQLGRTIALVADAGTPLISDPGFRLVRAARAAGVSVSCVPGPCAAIAALSVAGLPSDRFVFEGFLPARAAARRARLEELRAECRTLVFYESPRRLLALLEDLAAVIGTQREAVIARELTKRYETVLTGTVGELLTRVVADPDQQLGEIVLLLHGADAQPMQTAEVEPQQLLRVLLARMPLSESVDCAVEICGLPRNLLYRTALALQSATNPG